jgi:hypothetical protein
VIGLEAQRQLTVLVANLGLSFRVGSGRTDWLKILCKGLSRNPQRGAQRHRAKKRQCSEFHVDSSDLAADFRK